MAMALQRLQCLSCHTIRCHASYLMSDASVPRITVPARMQQKILRVKGKLAAKRHQGKRSYKGPVIISCHRPDYNHHKGQTYSNFNPQQLASGGWKHSKSKGDHFTINAFRGNPSVATAGSASAEEMHTDFAGFGFHKRLLHGLKELGILKPTHIQASTIPHMLQGRNILCAAETGSGKTLAFLLPIVEKINEHQQKGMYRAETNTPFAVVLTPSRELADQIYAVAKDLSEYTEFQPSVVCGGRETQRILQRLEHKKTDLLISTPGIFSKLLTRKVYSMSRLTHIVLDEADTLLDDSFNKLTIRLIQRMKVSTEKVSSEGEPWQAAGMQLAMVGATIPRSLEDIMANVVPMETLVKVTTPYLHKLMPHVPQKFVRLANSSKPEMLLTALKSNQKRRLPSIVFCNKSSTVCYLGYFLEDNGVANVILHANMPERVRQGRFEQFQSAEQNVLVCTDIASRGLDTVMARHVINYDFPGFMSDYIHRVGRVGRIGSEGSGFVLSFVTYKWDVDLLWKIEAAARRATDLPNVNANIKRKLDAIMQQKLSADSTNMVHL